MTRLEITVNALSDPAVVWEVYHGSDNLNWTLVTGSASAFDSVFLRYTLQFPQTTDQYFKAVNVSVNSQPNVLVTEVRALVDVPGVERRSREATTQRAAFLTRVSPNDTVTGTFRVGYNNDTGSGANLPFQETREFSYDSLISVALPRHLTGRVQYAVSDYRRDLAPVLKRNEKRYGASLVWSPSPTVDGLLDANRREEYEAGDLLRRSDVLRARALTELLPGLRLTSEVTRQWLDDPFSGFTLSSWIFKESFETRPTDFVTVNGGLMYQTLSTSGRFSVAKRVSAYSRVDWVVTPYLVAGGDWDFGREDGRDTLSQRYSLSWTPGPKLSLSGSRLETDALGDIETSSTAASLDYRLNRHLNLFATFSRSQLRQVLAATSRVTSLQFGLVLAF